MAPQTVCELDRVTRDRESRVSEHDELPAPRCAPPTRVLVRIEEEPHHECRPVMVRYGSAASTHAVMPHTGERTRPQLVVPVGGELVL